MINSPLTFSAIQAEFGGTNPISLSEYYANGKYVPRPTGDVALEGAIKVGTFLGRSNYTIRSFGQTGISAGTGDLAGWNASDDQGAYGPYAVRILSNFPWTAAWDIVRIDWSMTAYIDLGFRAFIKVNGTWNTSPICGIYHYSGGQGNVSGSGQVAVDIKAGSTIEWGYATGPAWQQILSNGNLGINYRRAGSV